MKFPNKLTIKDSLNENYVDLLNYKTYENERVKENQAVYGKAPKDGNWEMLVTYKDGKFISEHFYEHLDKKEWIEYKNKG